MKNWKSLAALCLMPLATLETSVRAEEPGVFQTPVSVEQLDAAAFAESVDGAERPLLTDKGAPDAPKEVIVTRTTRPGFIGKRMFDARMPPPTSVPPE